MIRRCRGFLLLALILGWSHAAIAGDAVRYEPAPSWVTPIPSKLASVQNSGDPALTIFDWQQRIERGQVWQYVDRAFRADTPEAVAAMATVAMAWVPNNGDLIVHRLEIARGDTRLDLIARGQRFTTIRREGNLEQRALDGVLTATLAAEGLQVGDTLRVTYSITSQDALLSGNAQSTAPVLIAPARVGFGRSILSWPKKERVSWKGFLDGMSPTETEVGGYRRIELTFPVAKPAELPVDAPRRFTRPPFIEASTFSSWADVASVMAPLYATEGTIEPGSELAAEVETIKRATSDPTDRALRALQLVQSKVRYFAIFLDGGNYRPQSPERTWALRYGECKAKTLLLLALLRDLGIDADPVLASLQTTNFLRARLPSALAFDHVLVRARIGDEILWLDGTGSAATRADIRDIPPLSVVLPVLASGAALIDLSPKPNARPAIEMAFDWDESGSLDIPAPFKVQITIRGAIAAQFATAFPQASTDEKKQIVAGLLQPYIGDPQLGDINVGKLSENAELTVVSEGVVATQWKGEARRKTRALGYLSETVSFDGDRNRPSWSAIPVVGRPAYTIRITGKFKLPQNGAGYSIENDAPIDQRIADFEFVRRASLGKGVADTEEELRYFGEEIGAERVAGERARAVAFRNRPLRIVAPAYAVRRWDPKAIMGSQRKAIEAVFAKAIAAAPDDLDPLYGRANFRAGTLDWRGTIADLSKMIAIAPTPDLFSRRAEVYEILGETKSAEADASAALALDPRFERALNIAIWLRLRRGSIGEALELVDTRLAEGGEQRLTFMRMKAALLGDAKRPHEAITLLDAALQEKPGTAALLNAKCWARATNAIELDIALKDCTRAIELSDDAASALDSRALVYFRLGRYEEALADSDAVIERSPNLGEARFLRAVIYGAMNRYDEAAREAAIAKLIQPQVERNYARYGLSVARRP